MKKQVMAAWAVLCFGLALMAGCGESGGDGSLSASTKRLTAVSTETDDSGQTDGSGTASGGTVASESDAEVFRSGYYDFSVKLLQNTYESGTNEMISPLSVLAALAMTENGAAGNTLSQMEDVLFGGLSVDAQNELFSAYMDGLPDTDSAKLNIANSIWVREGLEVEDSFLQKNSASYRAEVFTAPFDNSTVADINQWVLGETQGMIPKMLNTIEADTVMCLINAVAFDAQWEETYVDYLVREDVFTTEGGMEQTVEMMYSEEAWYLEDDNTTGFMKPYKDGYRFVALLPEEGMSTDEYVSGLSAEKLSALLENATTAYTVEAALPKFSYEYSVELSTALQSMGITDAFGGEADFSGISADSALLIDAVQHKTFIEVAEQGTKAGAATAVMVKETAAVETEEPKTVYLDRPFVYLIVDTENNLPVFFGVVAEV